MMKNIIIAGVSRTGKSILAKKIAREFKMTYIPFDTIVSTLENLYPQIGIAHRDENIEMSKRIAELLNEFIKHLEYEDINYVLDLYQVFPLDLKKAYGKGTHIVAYLGYPNLTAEEKLAYIKKFAREKDWTKKTSDEEMIRILNLFIKESKLMQKQCLEEGVTFFDTGEEFEETLFRAYKYLTDTIK